MAAMGGCELSAAALPFPWPSYLSERQTAQASNLYRSHIHQVQTDRVLQRKCAIICGSKGWCQDSPHPDKLSPLCFLASDLCL